MEVIKMSKLSDSTHRTTVFIPSNIKEKIPDRVNLSGLIRDLLSDYVNYGVGGKSEWKKGFKELYTLFEDVMENVDGIIKQKKLWNTLVGIRDLDLIDKLAGEL